MLCEQKQKYSNAIEKQSTKLSAVGMNDSGYLGISKDISVKHLVSRSACSMQLDVLYLFSCLKIHVCVLQCRSFGDLTSLDSEEYNISSHFQLVYVSLVILLSFLFNVSLRFVPN